MLRGSPPRLTTASGDRTLAASDYSGWEGICACLVCNPGATEYGLTKLTKNRNPATTRIQPDRPARPPTSSHLIRAPQMAIECVRLNGWTTSRYDGSTSKLKPPPVSEESTSTRYLCVPSDIKMAHVCVCVFGRHNAAMNRFGSGEEGVRGRGFSVNEPFMLGLMCSYLQHAVKASKMRPHKATARGK